jgi:hypothetical protein
LNEDEQRQALADHLAECDKVFESIRSAALEELPAANTTPLDKARRRLVVVDSVAVALMAKLEHLDLAPKTIDAKFFGPARSGLVAQIRQHRVYREKVATELETLEAAEQQNRGKDIARSNAIAGIRKVAAKLAKEIERYERTPHGAQEDARHEAAVAALAAKFEACAAYLSAS